MYDFTKSVAADDDSGTGNALEELVIDKMDAEQIWQQLELNNEEVVDQSIRSVPAALSIGEDKLKIPYKGEAADSEEAEISDDEELNGAEESLGEEEVEEEEEEEYNPLNVLKKSLKTTISKFRAVWCCAGILNYIFYCREVVCG